MLFGNRLESMALACLRHSSGLCSEKMGLALGADFEGGLETDSMSLLPCPSFIGRLFFFYDM